MLFNDDHREPVIKFVDGLIKSAISSCASDIHIEPQQHDCRIRMRQDGLLRKTDTIPTTFAKLVCTRLKILAKMNIAETRMPQDGRISCQSNADIRASTCPTLFGEKIVLRILSSHLTTPLIPALGMNKEQSTLFVKTLTLSQGLILVTGPTGSGKTTTLYAALQHLNKIEMNIVTVEDPIEIAFPGINQTNIHPQIGLDFSTSLRMLLRQDPDVIMIGEIRDNETAAIAIQAAQTGHLVLSTLHTNSINETTERLQALGVRPETLARSVSLIISQRLVRKLRDKNSASDDGAYSGRTGIFELSQTINHCEHHPTLWEAGIEKIQTGITTQDELSRVLSPNK